MIRALELRREGGAFLGFLERQTNLYKRYWVWEVVWVFYSLVSVLSIGYLASGLGTLGAGGAHFDLRAAQLYLLVGSVLWSYLSMVFFEVAWAIGWERWEGTIEYTFMAPMRRVTHLLGVCVFAVVYGLARTALILVVVQLLFHLDLSRANLGAAALIMVASTFPLLGLGILTSILPLLSPEKGEQMAVAAQGFLLLVSGVYYPLTVLPLPLQMAGYLSPMTYTLEGIRRSLLQAPTTGAMLPTVWLLLAMGWCWFPSRSGSSAAWSAAPSGSACSSGPASRGRSPAAG
jgi:ABC-2 type transport system permease protein